MDDENSLIAQRREKLEALQASGANPFGHAFENLSHYELRHGEAVAMGLVAASRLSERLELCDPSLTVRTRNLLQRLHLPTSYSQFAAAAALDVMLTDKKKEQGKIRFVLPVELGKVIIRGDIPREQVMAVFE